jgi:PAS domain S-box-containing protein
MDKTIRILLLEDNPADADLIEFELQEAGISFTLKLVMTEADFVQSIKEYLPDIILSDFDLPRYNGALALAEAKTICPDIPFILVTGAIDEERAIDMLTSGAKDYVMKKHLHRLAPSVLRVVEEAWEIKAHKTAQVELLEAYRTLENRVKKRTAKLQAEIKERKKTEKALRDHQLNANTLLNSATESIWMFGVNGDILTANDTAAQRLGLTVSDVIGRKWTDFIPSPLLQSRQRKIEEVIRTGKQVDYEDEQAGIFFHHYYYPARDIAGKIIGVTCFSRDITESKNADAEIKRLASFPLLNPNPVIEVDMASRIKFANPASDQLFPDLRKKGAEHPLLAGLAEIIQTFRKGKEKECSREVRIKGTWYLLAFSFVADSQSVRIYGLEITKHKIAQDELLESKKKISATLNPTTDAYIACDRQWHIVDMNAQMEKLLGLSKDKLVGKILWEVFPEMKDGEFVRRFQTAMAGDTFVHFEAKSVLGKWYETHVYPSANGLDVYLRDVTSRKQAEEALRKSEERFAIILASIGDAVIAADIEGKITFMNAMAEEITGWKFPKALLKSAGEVFHIINEQTRREDESPIKRVLETGMKVGLANHTILVRKDKMEVAIDDSAAPIKDQQGNIIGVVLVFRDITERRKREATLHRLNRTLMALSNSNHALLHADDESTYMKEVCRIIREDCGHAMVWIGFAENDEGKSVRPVAYAGFEERYLETLKITWEDTERGHGPTGTAIRTCKPSGCSNMFTDPQFEPWRKEAKKRGYASSICLPLMSGDKAFGTLTIYSGKPDSFQEDEIKLLSELAYDLANGITTLRLRVSHAQAEENSHRAKEYWERTFDAVPDMIAIIDTNFHIVQANKAMADRLGLTPHSCIGQICYKVVHGSGCSPSFCPHRQTMTDRLEHAVEVKEGLLDGDFIVSTSPLFEPDGSMIGSVHVARDITKYKQAEMVLEDQAAKLQEHSTQLEEINKELESFSYSVSHDLRAPLRAIDGYTRMILKDQIDKLDDEAKRKFNLIRSNTQIMGKLIDDLLSFSRLGRMEINMTRLYMEDLINDVWKEIQIISPDRKLILKINNINPRSWGDRSLIRQVYSNLLSNAAKYTKFNKKADIETGGYQQGNEDVYYVKDNGVGFDMNYYDKLFGVFQRLHSADEYEGTGVGLAIVQRIIHRHGGRVWAEGEEGKGATFYFTLLRRS